MSLPPDERDEIKRWRPPSSVGTPLEDSPTRLQLLSESDDEDEFLGTFAHAHLDQPDFGSSLESGPLGRGRRRIPRSADGTPFRPRQPAARSRSPVQGAHAFAHLEQPDADSPVKSSSARVYVSPSVSPIRRTLSNIDLNEPSEMESDIPVDEAAFIQQLCDEMKKRESEREINYRQEVLNCQVNRLAFSWYMMFRRLQSSLWCKLCHRFFPRHKTPFLSRLVMAHNSLPLTIAILQTFRMILSTPNILVLMKEIRSRGPLLRYILNELEDVLVQLDEAKNQGNFRYRSDTRGRFGPPEEKKTHTKNLKLLRYMDIIITSLFQLMKIISKLFYGPESEVEERDRSNALDQAFAYIESAIEQCVEMREWYSKRIEPNAEAKTIISTPDETLTSLLRPPRSRTSPSLRRSISFGGPHRVKFIRLRDENISFQNPITYNFPDSAIDREREFSFPTLSDLNEGMKGYRSNAVEAQIEICKRVFEMENFEAQLRKRKKEVPKRTLQQRIEHFQVSHPLSPPPTKDTVPKDSFIRFLSEGAPDERTILMASPEKVVEMSPPRVYQPQKLDFENEDTDDEVDVIVGPREDDEGDSDDDVEVIVGPREDDNVNNHDMIRTDGRRLLTLTTKSEFVDEQVPEIPWKRIRRSG